LFAQVRTLIDYRIAVNRLCLSGPDVTGVPDSALEMMMMMIDKKPVWPTWVVGALFRGVRRIHIKSRM
jgi:hypothetical protein